MFGGLAFLVGGNMAVAASGQGGILVRVDPEASDGLVATTGARVMEMRGREMPGWLRVEAADVGTEPDLAAWVERGVSYARSLPARADPSRDAPGGPLARRDMAPGPRAASRTSRARPRLGCGTVGGHVPRLRAAGYNAIGVDPAAPDGTEYRQVELERYEPEYPFDAVVASTSLHHVADPAEVLDRIVEILAPGGQIVLIEWDWEAFDEPTAERAFRRLVPGDGANWLRHHREEWAASRLPWSEYLRGWAGEHGIHPAPELLRLLDERFLLDAPVHGPYLFADLDATTEEEEQAAITAGEISATRVEVVGSAPSLACRATPRDREDGSVEPGTLLLLVGGILAVSMAVAIGAARVGFRRSSPFSCSACCSARMAPAGSTSTTPSSRGPSGSPAWRRSSTRAGSPRRGAGSGASPSRQACWRRRSCRDRGACGRRGVHAVRPLVARVGAPRVGRRLDRRGRGLRDAPVHAHPEADRAHAGGRDGPERPGRDRAHDRPDLLDRRSDVRVPGPRVRRRSPARPRPRRRRRARRRCDVGVRPASPVDRSIRTGRVRRGRRAHVRLRRMRSTGAGSSPSISSGSRSAAPRRATAASSSRSTKGSRSSRRSRCSSCSDCSCSRATCRRSPCPGLLSRRCWSS